jgi:type II secretory pathway pseudopilin PulG
MTNESLMRKYLLGDLPANERTRIEGEYFADFDLFEELVGAENDLIDSYVRGSLSDSEKRQFEQQYGKRPERRARIAFAKALSEAVHTERESITAIKTSSRGSFLSYFQLPRPQLQWALASAAVVLVGAVLALQNYRLRGELQEAQANTNQSRQQQDALRRQIAELGAQRQPVPESERGSQIARLEPLADLPFTLVPGVSRGSATGLKDLVVPHNSAWVRLEMVLDRDEFKTYEAVIQTAEGKEVVRGKALRSQLIGGSAVVAWRFPSLSIHSGDYVVQLMGKTATGGLEGVESYGFRVVRK